MNKYFILLSVLLFIFGLNGFLLAQDTNLVDITLDGKDMSATFVLKDTSDAFSIYNLLGASNGCTIYGRYDTASSAGQLPGTVRVDLQIADSTGLWAEKVGSDSILSFTEGGVDWTGTWIYDVFTMPEGRYGRFITTVDTVRYVKAAAGDTATYRIRLRLDKK